MAIFAVTSGDSITNMIIADSKEIAEQVTKNVCIEHTPENPISQNWVWNGTKFIAPIMEEPNAQL